MGTVTIQEARKYAVKLANYSEGLGSYYLAFFQKMLETEFENIKSDQDVQFTLVENELNPDGTVARGGRDVADTKDPMEILLKDEREAIWRHISSESRLEADQTQCISVLGSSRSTQCPRADTMLLSMEFSKIRWFLLLIPDIAILPYLPSCT
jgi:hypothetical protein